MKLRWLVLFSCSTSLAHEYSFMHICKKVASGTKYAFTAFSEIRIFSQPAYLYQKTETTEKSSLAHESYEKKFFSYAKMPLVYVYKLHQHEKIKHVKNVVYSTLFPLEAAIAEGNQKIAKAESEKNQAIQDCYEKIENVGSSIKKNTITLASLAHKIMVCATKASVIQKKIDDGKRELERHISESGLAIKELEQDAQEKVTLFSLVLEKISTLQKNMPDKKSIDDRVGTVEESHKSLQAQVLENDKKVKELSDLVMQEEPQDLLHEHSSEKSKIETTINGKKLSIKPRVFSDERIPKH